MGVAKVIVNGSTIIDVTQKTVSSNNLLSGITALGANGENVIGNYVVPTFTTQSKTVTPTESSQSIFPDSGYSGLSQVTVNAISSTFVGSGITRRTSTALTANGSTITAPAGYYSSAVSKSIGAGTAFTPATTITANPIISIDGSGVILATVSVNSSITPSVSAGYISSGTAGNITVSGASDFPLTTKAATTIVPTENEQIAVNSGVYTTGSVKVAGISSTYVGTAIPQKSSSDLTFTGGTFTTPSGYYSTSAYKNITVGGLPTPSIILGINGVINASATLRTDAWIPSSTTTSTYQIPSLAATTYTPTTTNQIISSQKYLVGSQTILGDANLIPDNIASGVSIFGVTGTHSGGSGVNELYEKWAENSGTFYFYANVSSHAQFLSEQSVVGSFAFAKRKFSGSGSLYFNNLQSSMPYGCFFLISGGVSAKLIFPTVTTMDSCVFMGGQNINVEFPICSNVGNWAFASVNTGEIIKASIEKISFPACSTIGVYAFANASFATSAKTIDFSECSYIGNYAFIQTNITSASFPKCTSVGIAAFSGCGSLLSAYFPLLQSVSINQFAQCYKLQNVTITSATFIAASAFSACSSLESVSIPYCVSISSYAFSGCNILSSIYCPNVRVVSNGAFYNCKSLTEISLSTSYFSIYSNTFQYCSNLLRVNAPNVSLIYGYAFAYCSALSEVSFSQCSYISNLAFQSCGGLVSASFDFCTTVSSLAFISCYSLANIYFPRLEYIGTSAFAKCSALQVASFPRLKSIGMSAFSDCSSLSSLYLMGSTYVSITNSMVFYGTPFYSSSGTIFVPESMVDTYKTMQYWSYFSNRFVGVTE